MYRTIGNIQTPVSDSQRIKPIAHIEWKPNRVTGYECKVVNNVTRGVCQSGHQLHICRLRVKVVGKRCAIEGSVTDSSPCWRNGLVTAGAHLLAREDSKDKGVWCLDGLGKGRTSLISARLKRGERKDGDVGKRGSAMPS
jgi:hypothetical protein